MEAQIDSNMHHWIWLGKDFVFFESYFCLWSQKYTLEKPHPKKNMYSYWERNHWFDKVDYCIVGAGYVGLLTAIYLSEKYPEKNLALVDAYAIPQGASTKNAGFTCFGSVGELSDDLGHMSEEELVELIRMRYQGLQQLEETIPAASYDYINCGGQEVFTSRLEFEQVASKFEKANSLMEQAMGVSDVFEFGKLQFSTKLHRQVIENRYEGQLNPVKLFKALMAKARSQGVQIYTGFKVSAWNRLEDVQYDIMFEGGMKMTSHELIFTTNAFTKTLLSDLDILPKRNQVLVSKPMDLQKLNGTFHHDKGYVYFRNVGQDRLLIGGARNKDAEMESTSVFAPNEKIIEHLVKFAKRYLNDSFVPDFSWSGIIATGKNKFPIIKKSTAGPYIAARLGGMGVATGSQVARCIVDLI